MMEILRNYLNTIRREYATQELDEKSASNNPYQVFEKWFEEAVQAQVLDPNAMILSTVSNDGSPSSRVVLLRSISEQGFVFYTNYNSKKSKDIDHNCNVFLTFFWVELNRQIHVKGITKKENSKDSDKYFSTRPKESQLAAWTSPQSEEIANRDILLNKYAEFEVKFKDKEVTRPPFWGGYLVIPKTIEFWQGRTKRLHDRLRYSLLKDKSWKIDRIAP